MKVLGILLALMGCALMCAGILGVIVDVYYIVVGFGITVSGVLIALNRVVGVYIYGITLVLVYVWSMIEFGTDYGNLIPSLFLPTIIGVYLFSDKVLGNLKLMESKKDSGK